MIFKSLSPVFLVSLSLLIFNGCSSNENKGKSHESDANPVKMEAGIFFSGIAEPCAKSKNYNQAEWIDKNDCSWALEKKLLVQYPEFGKRNGENLLLQLDNGSWQTYSTATPENSKAPYYHQWKAYYPKSHYFLVEQIKPAGCNSYIWIDGKTGNQTRMSGDLWFSSGSKWMAIIPNGLERCKSTSELLRFSTTGQLLQYPLDLGTGIKDIAWSETHIFGKKDANGSSKTLQKLPEVH